MWSNRFEELTSYVQEKVHSGMYHSAGEVIREGLRLLKERDVLQEIRHQELRNLVQHGFSQIDKGKFRDFATTGDLTAHIVDAGRSRATSPDPK